MAMSHNTVGAFCTLAFFLAVWWIMKQFLRILRIEYKLVRVKAETGARIQRCICFAMQ
jgi:hypothetical protein